MKKHLIIAFIGIAILSTSVVAQEIDTQWMTTHNDDGELLPILIKKGRTLDADGNEVGSWTDGTRTQDRYFGLHRYDESRLLLGVFGNGINENDPEDSLELAEEFPDRSLIWIDAHTGEPLGVALELGVVPMEPTDLWMSEDFYGAVPFFMAFDIDDDGNIYVAYGEYILRYTPDGNDSFTGPEVVHQLDIEEYGPEDWGISTFSVRGSGTDTELIGGQNGTGFYFTTEDGDNFELTMTFSREGWPGVNGAMSNIVRNTEFLEEYVYVSGYGNNSAGNDSSFYRLVRAIGNEEEPFVNDEDFFQAQGMPDSGDLEYKAQYIGDVASYDDAEYITAYSTPSWNAEIKESPGFIGLHDATASLVGEQDGAYVTHLEIPVYTTEEPRLPDALVSSWYGTEGTLEVNVPETAEAGAFEIIWCGGIYGMGVFSVGDTGTNVNEWSLY